VVDQDGQTLVHEKANLTGTAKPVTLVWDEGVLVPASPEMRQIAANDQGAEDAVRLLEVISIANANGTIVPAATSGPSTLWSELEPYPEYRAAFSGSSAVSRTKAAAVSLVREGRIVKTMFAGSGRHKRECYQLAQPLAQNPPNAPVISPEKCAPVIPPYPPSVTRARAEGARVTGWVGNQSTCATRATRAPVCRRCDGEGCAYCESKAIPDDEPTNGGAR
jgi:hypothetical protein